MIPDLPAIPRDFGFSEEHDMLRQSVRRFLDQRFDRRALRAYLEAHAAGAAPAFDAAGFAEIVALGWTAPPNWLAAALMCEEIGRALYPLPVAATLIAAHALEAHGAPPQPGPLAVALTEAHGRFAPGDIVATAGRDLDGYRLEGSFAQVIAGGQAQALLAPFRLDGALAWFVVPSAAMVAEVDRTMDPTRPTARVTVAARVPESARIAGDGDAIYQALWLRSLTLYAAEAVGAAEAAFGMTRDYACERQQFGRPIGSYQAVSHPLVDAMIALERARSLTIAAAAALDAAPEGEPVEIIARMASTAASEALWRATSRGVQLHGGFGFTWDCDMHFFFRRALCDRGAFGSPEDQRRWLSDRLLG